MRDIGEAARLLRQSPTRGEALLWEALRGRRLQGFKFRRQHPLGRLVVDFYCAEARLAVEIDGPAHDSDAARAHDRDRDQYMKDGGIGMVRVRDVDVEHDFGGVLTKISDALVVQMEVKAAYAMKQYRTRPLRRRYPGEDVRAYRSARG